jgi:hypothetical protein
MTHDDLTMDTTADAETTSKPTPAPRIRQALAALIDATVMALPTAIYAGRAWSARGTGRRAARPPDWTRMLAPMAAVLGEQVGTPGGWIMGVRTVDGRTGRRLALWRTLTVALVQVATRLLSRWLRPRPVRPSADERRRQAVEAEAIKERYADDEQARNTELMRHYAEHRVNTTVSFWPQIVAGLGATLVNRTVRRRLAPTLVVARRPAEPPSSDHSP